jgi:ABC-type multidrug transport system fused ATPase/permease subunit
LVLAGCTLVAGLVPAAAAYVGKLVVDGVVRAAASGAAEDREQVLWWVALEALLLMVGAGAQRGLATAQSLLRAVMAHRITSMIMEKALTLQLAQFEDPEIHDRMMQARREAVARPLALVTGTFALIKETIALLTFGGLLLQFSGWAVVVIVAAGLPAFVVEAYFSGEAFRFLRSKTPEIRERSYLETVVTREDFAKELLIFRLGRTLLRRYHELFYRLYGPDRWLQLRRGAWGVVLGWVSLFALYGAYGWVIVETIAGHLSLGEMTMYVMLFRQGQASVSASLTHIGGMYENNLYLSNLYEFLEYEVPAPQGDAQGGLKQGRGLVFDNVTFTYPGQQHPALKSVSFQLRPGQKLALVGANGSGKTTLVKLLTRLHEPDQGRILFLGRDVRSWDLSALRRRVAVIFQDFARFKFKVGENIGVGDVDFFADEQRWHEAAERALAAPLVQGLPQAYHTQLGRSFWGGYELSGGEWQKVALARLFMRRHADLFVLDEPTAAVDAEAEARIFEQVQEATLDRMAILISHRLSIPRSADLILVLSAGTIVERGTHDELMNLNGQYAKLFTLQADGYRD